MRGLTGTFVHGVLETSRFDLKFVVRGHSSGGGPLISDRILPWWGSGTRSRRGGRSRWSRPIDQRDIYGCQIYTYMDRYRSIYLIDIYLIAIPATGIPLSDRRPVLTVKTF
jgi:hypothetical protein